VRVIPAIARSLEARRVFGVITVAILATVTVAVLQERDSSSRAPLTSTPPPTLATTLPSATFAGTPSPDPAETPEPTFLRYEVALAPGQYTLFRFDGDGTITSDRRVGFDQPSHAPVDRIETDDGDVHWRTVIGPFTGWSYVPGDSGAFTIREVLRWPDGTITYREADAG